MFHRLLDFSYRRNIFEALGFYIVSLVFVVVISIAGAYLYAAIGLSGEEGKLVMLTLNAVICFVIGGLIVLKRQLVTYFTLPVLLLSSYLAFIGEEKIGLLFVSMLAWVDASWLKRNNSQK